MIIDSTLVDILHKDLCPATIKALAFDLRTAFHNPSSESEPGKHTALWLLYLVLAEALLSSSGEVLVPITFDPDNEPVTLDLGD